MADYFVATSSNGGSDSNDGSQITDAGGGVGPFETIQHAVNQCTGSTTHSISIGTGTYADTNGVRFQTGQNGSTITVKPVAGNIVTINSDGTDTAFYLYTIVGGHIIVEDIIIDAVSGTNSCVRSLTSAGDTNLTITRCTLGNDSVAAIGINLFSETSATREIVVTDCIFNNVKQIIECSSAALLQMTGGTYTTATAANALHGFNLSGVIEVIIIDDIIYNFNTVSTTHIPIRLQSSIDPNYLQISNLTCSSTTGFITIAETANADSIINFFNNDVTVNAPVTATHAFFIGGDGTAGTGFGYLRVENNSVEYTGAGTAHAYLIGQGVDGATISSNHSKNGNAQYVLKGDNLVFFNNTGYGPITLLIKGSQRCDVHNNSFHSTDSGALNISEENLPGPDVDPQDVNLSNNIFLYDGTGHLIKGDVGEIPDPLSFFFDSNCYFNTQTLTAFANVSAPASDPANFTEWQDLWATWGSSPFSANNEDNSLFHNPSFKNSANGDFTVQNAAIPSTFGAVSTSGSASGTAYSSIDGGGYKHLS